MDRTSSIPDPVLSREPSPTEVAVEAFMRRLDPTDPIVVAFNDAIVPMVVSDPTLPDNPLIHVNAAFEAMTGFSAGEVIGRNCRFLQGPLTDAADVERMRAGIAKHERVDIDLLNHHRDGTPFWNRLMVVPVFDEAGKVRYFVASQLDVTIERQRVVQLQEDRKALQREIAAHASAMEAREGRLSLALKAGGLGTWALSLPDENLTTSPSCNAIFGYPVDRPFTYEQFKTSLHPDDREHVQAAIGATIDDNAPYNVEYRILTPAGEQRWVHVQAELQYRADGSPLAMSGFTTDISDRRFAEEHRAVLTSELTHRVKNTLATVSAVVNQTLRDASSLADARTAVSGRIASLGAAHELLVKGETEGAAIGEITQSVLAPFMDRGGERFSLEGPSIRLTPEITLALSMALHELATNAVKYGALSVPEGYVAIRWGLIDNDADRRFCFSWIERDGPPVSPPTRTGFGSRMIERVLSRHVRDKATIAYLPEGIRFEIEAPI